MSSRGSAIPFFRELASQAKPITITHTEMTRFLLTLNDAIDLVLFAVENMKGGETFIKKAPAVRIMDLARVIAQEFNVPFDPVVIGMLPGEKLHEILISEEELPRATDLGDYYVVQPHWVKCEGRRWSGSTARRTTCWKPTRRSSPCSQSRMRSSRSSVSKASFSSERAA